MATIALCAVAVGFGACGSTNLEKGRDQAEIVHAVVLSLVSSDPAHCRDLYTQSLMNQMSDGMGEEAFRDCVRNESDPDAADANSVDVSAPIVNGSKATASVHVVGGDFDRATLELRLVKADSGWRLDRLEDVEFNRPAFDRALRASRIRDGLSPREARCVVRVTRRRFDTEDLEAALLGFDEPREDPALKCYGVRDIRSEWVEQSRAVGQASELPVAVVDCMVNRIRQLSGKQIHRLSEIPSEEQAARGLGRLWQECTGNLPETDAS